jgi:hypothetical protein
MDVHVDHPRENEPTLGVHNLRRIGLKPTMSQRLDLATIDDDVSLEESAWIVNSTVFDDEIDRQNLSPIHPALIRTYIFLKLRDGII